MDDDRRFEPWDEPVRRRSWEQEPEPPRLRVLGLRDFKKPKLPPLRGTPSSRRQFSYGSGAEPAPGRSARQGRQADLNSVVQGVVTRDQEEAPGNRNKRDGRSTRRQGSRQPSHPVEDEDELARSEADYRPRMSTTGERPERDGSHSSEAPAQGRRRWATDGSEFDDTRSFDMENDYYERATIKLTTGIPFPIIESPPIFSVPGVEEGDEQQNEQQHPKTAAELAEWWKARQATVEEEARQAFDRYAAENPVAPVSPPASENPVNLGHGISEERFQPYKSEQGRLSSRLKLLEQDELTREATSQNNVDEDPTQGSGSWLRLPSIGSSMGFFSRSPRRTNTDSQIRTDHSEMDDAIQQHIQEAEAEATRQRRAREAEARREEWRQRWAELKSLSPWRQSRSTNGERLREVDDDDDEDAIDWWQLLNPLTYLEAVVWLLRSMVDRIVSAFSYIFTDPVRQHLVFFGGAVIYLIIGLLTLLMAIALSRVAFAKLPTDMGDLVTTPRVPTPSWPSFGTITGKIGDYIPSISIPWPSRRRWDDFPSLSNLTDHQHSELEDSLSRIFRELRLLKEADRLHEASIKKLDSIVPKLVHMKLKDGKPVITQEFWHAIRDLIHQDGSFLTLDKKGNTYEVSSERQWQAIAARLAKDPAFTSQLNLSIGKMEDRLAEKLPHAWDTWITNNQRKISQMLGSALDKMKLTGPKEDLDARLEEVVKKHFGKTKAGGVVVTRDEFLRHLKNEFAAHRAEMRAEISELQPKIEQLVRESIELANCDTPSGMTRAEITALVNGLIRKAIADANLEAMAKNRIHDHWDKDLKNQVNYFGVGAGATINAARTSPTYKPSKEYINQKGLAALKKFRMHDPFVALQPWHDDGDYWCGTRKINKRGNPYAAYFTVTLGHTVIPQHLIIEHILPGATTDPEARPRDIEIYASFEDPVVRERVRDFAAAHFPDDESDWNYTPTELPHTFAKIGQFVYEGAELQDGVHVHRLSTELMALGAETDMISVRAISNYGAKDYTCFYRVRLFGHKAS